MAEINPRLIMVRVSGFGQYGPYSSQPGFGTVIEAMSGFAHLTGQPDGPPTLPQFALADSFAGCYATMAAMFAVYHRDVIGTGKGQMIDVSLWESLFSMLGPNVLVNQLTGQAPMRTGNRTTTWAPIHLSIMASSASTFCSLDSLVAKRGSSASSDWPIAWNKRIAVAGVEPASATQRRSRVW